LIIKDVIGLFDDRSAFLFLVDYYILNNFETSKNLFRKRANAPSFPKVKTKGKKGYFLINFLPTGFLTLGG